MWLTALAALPGVLDLVQDDSGAIAPGDMSAVYGAPITINPVINLGDILTPYNMAGPENGGYGLRLPDRFDFSETSLTEGGQAFRPAPDLLPLMLLVAGGGAAIWLIKK